MSVSVRRGVLRLHQFGTGRHILDRLDDLNRTQWLSHDELLALQATKLQRLVEYAYQYVPYYRRTFDQIGFEPRDLKRRPDYLTQLPILTKAIIRANYRDMLTTEPHRRRQLSELCTSGSTGEPLVFMQDHDFRDAVTADVQRHMGWAGWTLGDRQAIIWGASLQERPRRLLRTQFIDWVWNRFLLNANSMTGATMSAFAKRVQHDKPDVLFGYATSLYYFARFVRHSEYNDLSFKAIFSSAERLLPAARSYIEETFACQVFDRYGTLDVGGIACECNAHTGLHVSVENNYVEIVQNDQPAAPDEVGDLVVTNLNNLGMPFIRYALGDAAGWQAGSACPCGRAAPRLKSLEGRIRDAFKTRDGRTIYTGFSGHAFHCLAHPSIRQFQIVQKTLDKIVVRLVAECEVPQSALDEITRTFRGTFGENVTVDFEFMDKIPLLPSGKHQYAVSEVNRS